MNPAPPSGSVVAGVASATPFQALGQSELGAIGGYSTHRVERYIPLGGTKVADHPSASPGYASPKYASRIMFTPGGTRVPDNTPPPTPPKAVSFGDISVKHWPTSPSGYVQPPGPSLRATHDKARAEIASFCSSFGRLCSIKTEPLSSTRDI